MPMRKKEDKKQRNSVPTKKQVKKQVKKQPNLVAGNNSLYDNSNQNQPQFHPNIEDEKSEKGYLYCMETFYSRDQIVYKLGKTKNLTERLKSYRTGLPGANFLPCCPPCKDPKKPYALSEDLKCINPPTTYLIDYHLAERVLHIFLSSYRCGNTECFNLKEDDIQEKIPKLFERIKKMNKSQLQNVIDNREIFEQINDLEKQLDDEKEKNKLLEQKLSQFTDEKIEELINKRIIEQVSVSAVFDKKSDEENVVFEEYKGQTEPVFEEDSKIEINLNPVPIETQAYEDDWEEDPSDDEEFEECDDAVQNVIESIRKAVTFNLDLDETDILYDFQNLTNPLKKKLLTYFGEEGLSGCNKAELEQKLIEWYDIENSIKVKIHFPFTISPNITPRSMSTFNSKFCNTFDNEFHKEISDEKNQEFENNITEMYLKTYYDDSSIDGYLTLRTYIKRSEPSIEVITRLRRIADWIIEKANNFQLFRGIINCDTSRYIALSRISNGLREWNKFS